MMKKLFLVISLFCLLCSCSSLEQITPTVPSHDDMVQVTIPIRVCGQQLVTRTDENRITDVNLYLAADGVMQKHIYTTTSDVSFRCAVGRYNLYVIANHHSDLGALSFDELLSYELHALESYEDLPMCATQTLELFSGNDLTLPPVEVKRVVAKIDYAVSLAPAMRDVELESVQVMCMAKAFQPFGDLSPKYSFEGYYNGSLVPNTGAADHFAGSLYMLPNMQGVVPKITSEEQKNANNAPMMATWLRIRAHRGNKILDYSVYLGENASSDFNVRPNTAHTLNILIRNDNTADVRIKSYTVDVQSTIAVEPENGIYLETAPISLTIDLQGDTSKEDLSCELIVNQGNIQQFHLNGIGGQSHYDLSLDVASGTTYCHIEYFPKYFDQQSVVLDFTLNFYDNYGFVTSRNFSYCYAKVIKVYTHWYDGPKYGGELSSSDALHWVKSGTLTSTFYLFYCSEEGCTLVATPDENQVFRGWYTGYNMTGKLGIQNSLFYRPISNYDTIYAYFWQ